MTPDEIRAAMVRMQLDEVGLTALLGVQPRTTEKYLAGKMDLPKPAVRLIWAAERDAVLRAELMMPDWLSKSA